MKYAFKNPVYKILIPILDFLGGMVFYPIRFFKKNPPLNPGNILIVRLDHIGDFICNAPVFKNIKKQFPGVTITALVNSASKELAFRDPNIDKVITFSPFYLNRGEKSVTFKGLMRVVKDVRNIGFDLGIDPRGDILSIVIMWLGSVKYRTGYGITGGGFLLNKVCRYDESKHAVDRNLVLLEALDIPVSSRSPEVYFNDEDIEVVERLLDSRFRGNDRWIPAFAGMTRGSGMTRGGKGIAPDKVVVIHPFAGAEAKEWPKENFQNLINRIKKDGRDVLLIGSANDEGRYENVIDMRGKLTLPQLAYLIKKIGFFIGLDSGPANMAAALNVNAIVICSGTNVPELWLYKSHRMWLIYKEVACKPCGLKICNKERHACMESIGVEDVLKKIGETWQV